MAQKVTSKPLAISYIRFSTLEQKKGNSFVRQNEKTKAFCEKMGWDLSEEIYLDEGLSAYSGKNQDEGQLGKLLRAIDEGVIPKGSFLVVESLDRISRQKVRIQMALFLQILGKGVNIATLTDGTIHYAESEADFTSLMIAIVTMYRANEESEVKSQRLKSAWSAKRKNLGTKPLTRLLPAWLAQDGDKIVAIPKRAAVVKEIFDDAFSGLGRRSIAKKLNERNEPVWGSPKRNKSNLWNDSYIVKILSNRAVLGEFQPHTKREGKRFKEGEPLENYFPRIIDDQLFYACQGGMKARIGKGGFAAPKARNLITTIGRCAQCGGKLYYMDKGPIRPSRVKDSGTKKVPHDQYLQCRAANLRSTKCSAAPVNYSLVERFMLSVLLVGRWEKIFPRPEDGGDDGKIILGLQVELEAVSKNIENLLDALEAGGERAVIRSRLDKNLVRQEQLVELIEKAKAAAAKKISSSSAYEDAMAAQMSQSGDDPKRRRLIKSVFEDFIDAVFLEKRDDSGVGFFVVLKSGMFVLGTESGKKRQSKRFEIVLAPWQLRIDEERLAIEYTFEEDSNENLRPSPQAYLIPKGTDLIEICLSEEAAKNIRDLGYIPTDIPDFIGLNSEQKRILTAQQKDFRNLKPDMIDFDFNDEQAVPTASFFGSEPTTPYAQYEKIPFDEKSIEAQVEENFRRRL